MRVYHHTESSPLTYRRGLPMRTGWYCENPGFLMGPFRTRAEAEGRTVTKTPLAGLRADFLANTEPKREAAQ
ncbi:hypothetical protein KU6B_48060 [Mameliella alba]|uniref:hypothetical protein n=1 Tax=Mameliella alba TaxID=561184 RepID=UPI0013E4C660|nr:hypothetical protein [Mameliella alba]BBU58541.1 hypothetical protein KU6B_48060 [Mameliella alba]